MKQYAVGVEQGGELLFRFVSDSLRANHELVAVSNDAKKAFQNFDRSVIWDLMDRVLGNTGSKWENTGENTVN